MITQKTCERIWHCYREIAAGRNLLKELAEKRERMNHVNPAREPVRLPDVFGRERDFQLGIPSGENSHQIYYLSSTLAESIITAHIANKEAELVEANEQARLELNTFSDGQIWEKA